jgi:hypothetical protein
MRQTSAPDQQKKGADMRSVISAGRNLPTKRTDSIFRILAALTFFFLCSPFCSAQIVKISVLEQFRIHNQHFSCTVEYAPEGCVRDLQRLHRLLEQYNADGLGEWQWVIVSRSEWKPFCVKLGVDFGSPAMTSFVDRQAFFDEALFEEDPIRARELVRKFGALWKDLLPLALTHELGHAVCRDATEERAEFYAEEIRRHRPGRCDSTNAPVWTFRASLPGK